MLKKLLLKILFSSDTNIDLAVTRCGQSCTNYYQEKIHAHFAPFLPFLVISHPFEVDVFKENVILGNDALMKCIVPSFVADLVTLDFWLEIETGREIRMGTLHGKLIMTSV